MDKYMREFYENIKDRFKCGLHNLYELTSVDRDGNVTDRKFGINVLTNYGFEHLYMKWGYDSNYTVKIGDGSGTPSVTDTDLFHQTITAGGTRTGDGGNNMPDDYSSGPKEILYNSTTGIISGIYCFDSYLWEYNYSGIDSPVPVTEIGIFLPELAVHSLVYDKQGNIASITKNPNQRLYLKIYFADNISETLIQTWYNNGKYFMVNPSTMISIQSYRGLIYSTDFLRSKYSSSNNSWHEYSRESYWGWECSHPLVSGSTEDRHVTIDETARVIEDKHDYFDIITFASGNGLLKPNNASIAQELVAFTLDRLAQDETLETDLLFTNSVTSIAFSNAFGLNYNSSSHAGELPVVDFNMSSLKMYNQLTDDWDIDETYSDASLTCYTNPFIFSCNIRVMLNDTIRGMYVYCNPFASRYHLLGFSNSGIVLYATDKYWDVSTYEVIPNIASLPVELQQKRYYISFSATALYPSWDYTVHKLTNVDPVETIDKIINIGYLWESYPTYSKTFMGDDERYHDPVVFDSIGATLIGITLMFPCEQGCPSYLLPIPEYEDYYQQTTDYTQTNAFITNGGDTMIWRKWISWNNNSSKTCKTFRVFDMTNCDSSTPPTYYDFDLNVSWSANYRQCWTSVNDRGIMVVSDREASNYTAHIVDINHLDENNKPLQHTITYARWCQVVECTTNYIYYDPRDNYFRIKAAADDALIAEFQLPQDQGISLAGMHAWKNKVLICGSQSGISYLYMYDISSGDLKSYDNRLVPCLYREFWNIGCSHHYACDDFFIIGGGTTSSSYFESYGLVETIMLDNNHYASDPLFFGGAYGLRRLQVKSFNNGKQILATMTFRSYYDYYNHDLTYVVDIGYLRNKGSDNNIRYGVDRLSSYRWQYANAIMVQDKVFLIPSESAKCRLAPYQVLVPHKTSGTTRTIQSYNNPKRLSGKQFKLVITNNPSKYSPT